MADPTGAGDAFDGVFLAAAARGASPAEALRRASAAGARVVQSLETWPEAPPERAVPGAAGDALGRRPGGER